MEIEKTILDGVYIINPVLHQDERGWFMESFKSSIFKEKGISIDFIQDNHSLSKDVGILRGLHYQEEPFGQSKLVRCIKGSIFDVAVDIRKDSPTYKKWIGVELSEKNNKQILIPRGFAHGFLTLENETEVIYKVDNVYNKESDRSIAWNDPDINIEWPNTQTPILSEKDKNAPLLKDIL